MGRFIVEPTVQNELAHHHEDKRPDAFEDRLIWMSDTLVADADLFVSSRSLKGLVEGNGDDGTDLHEHPVAQLYILLSDDQSLRVEALIAGELTEVHAPASIYIPAFVEHQLRIVAGTGTVVAILASGHYQ